MVVLKCCFIFRVFSKLVWFRVTLDRAPANTNKTLQNELMRREAVGLLIIASADVKTCEKQLVFNTLQLLATKQKS